MPWCQRPEQSQETARGGKERPTLTPQATLTLPRHSALDEGLRGVRGLTGQLSLVAGAATTLIFYSRENTPHGYLTIRQSQTLGGLILALFSSHHGNPAPFSPSNMKRKESALARPHKRYRKFITFPRGSTVHSPRRLFQDHLFPSEPVLFLRLGPNPKQLVLGCLPSGCTASLATVGRQLL